ncbi:MAG: zf-TFIIB domain-containing protein [Candidatus Thermoplasmatota archaeon]
MKCGKCRVNMRERSEERMGLKINIQECPRCGKRLIDLVDAERLQQRALSRIEDVRTVVAIGNSIGITLPAALKKILKKGDKVHLIWDMEAMEARLAKA